MNRNLALTDLGQSLWLDNISRRMLDDGTLERYIRDLQVSGLTSNPSIFEKAIAHGDVYDAAIAASQATSAEAVFFELAIADLRRAAHLFAPIHRRTHSADGWVSLEVSPTLADKAGASITAARELHQQASCKNLFIKLPGTHAGARAIEESIFAGVPINVTLLFSSEQYMAAAAAWMRGIERRIGADLDPHVDSVASLFVSRWDVAANRRVPEALHNRLGIAVAQRTYRAHRTVLESPRAQALIKAGARPQRLLWASTGTKDPAAPDTLYVEALAAPDTINTLPDKTLEAFADHGSATHVLGRDGGDADRVIAEFEHRGIDTQVLAIDLQREGVEAFVKSWQGLLAGIETKRPVGGRFARAVHRIGGGTR